MRIKKNFSKVFVLFISLLVLVEISIGKKPKHKMNKLEYYNTYISPSKGRPPILQKVFGFEDRKRSVFDVGNLRLRFSNAATLGYDRWGWNHEFPQGSMDSKGCCTFYWTLSPIIGGLIKGQPSVAVGVRGSVRDHEEEFEPLSGYDADLVDEEANIGIPFNDKPASWPAAWPIETDPTGSYTDPVTQLTFEGIERPLDMDHPDGSGLRFPGVFDGKVVATRETYFVVTDNDPLEGNTMESNGAGPLNVRIDMWGLQYSDILNQDFIIWWEKFTNVGSDTLYEVFVGLAGDPDTPEQGGAEWTDDYSVFIQRGDSHMAEKLADTTDSHLLWDLALIWDGDDKAEGYVSSGLSWIGLKALKTPYTQSADGIDNDLDGVTDEGFDGIDNDGDGEIDEEDEQEEMGVTNYFAFPYDFDAQSDNEAYFTQIRAGFGEDSEVTGYQETPHDEDIWQKPYAYGPDITTVMTSGPFTMAPGQSLDFVFADIIGVNELDVLTNAKTSQRLFNVGFKASVPPDEPVVHSVASDGQITLYWDAYPSEFSIDPNTGNNAFQGYRIYKSTDRGATWGDPITDGRGNVVFFKPQVIYDLQDDISGLYAYGSPEVYYDLGSNSGLQYSYTDVNVMNGVEYWYAVSAYDAPDGIVPPLENAPKKSRSDALTSGNNTVVLIPQARQVGWEDGMIELQHLEGNSTAELLFDIYDPGEFAGYDYPLSINDDLDNIDDTTKSFSVLNNNTFTFDSEISETGTKLPYRNILAGSVVITGLANEEFIEDVDYSIDLSEGKIYALKDTASVTPHALEKGTMYTISYKYYPVFESTNLAGEGSNSTFEGIRLTVQDVDSIVPDTSESYWYNPNNIDSLPTTNWHVNMEKISTPTSYDYLIFFTTDSGETYIPPGRSIPIQLWNLTKGEPVEKIMKTPPPPAPGGPINSGDKIKIMERLTEGGSLEWTWQFEFLTPELDLLSHTETGVILWDTTQTGNGQYDDGEPFTDLDADSIWDEGEPFVDTYFDTSAAISELIGPIEDSTFSFTNTLDCDSVEIFLDTTFQIMNWTMYDTLTFSFDTTLALHVSLNLQVVCDTSITPVTIGNGQYDAGEYFSDLDSSGTWDEGEPFSDMGDAIYLCTAKPLTSKDIYLIQTSTSKVSITGKKQLNNIKVVPNPYIVTSAPEQNIEVKEIQFHNLPELCTIRIFTIAGELVRVIEHRELSSGWRGPGIEAWDLRTYNDQEVAFGIYIFHIETEGASKTFNTTGKFAIIR